MLDVLPRLPIFQDLNSTQVELLKSLFEPYNCPAEEVIFEQGMPATYLYLIVLGEVAIRYKPYDGPVITLTRLREGDIFGWSAVVGSLQYTSSIVSISRLEAIRIRGADLLRLSESVPDTGSLILERITRIVTPRWKKTETQLHSFHDR